MAGCIKKIYIFIISCVAIISLSACNNGREGDIMPDGTREITRYYKNGHVRCIYHLKNDSVYTGEFKQFYKSGKIQSSSWFVDGLNSGPQTEYYKNGKIKWILHCTMGKED